MQWKKKKKKTVKIGGLSPDEVKCKKIGVNFKIHLSEP